MAEWYLGIDETGDFAFDDKAQKPKHKSRKPNYKPRSFALAVVVREDNYSKLDGLYRKAHAELKLGKLQNPNRIIDVLKCFHYTRNEMYSGFTKVQKNYLAQQFSPLMHCVIHSVNRPVLFGNQQDWWLRAVEAVIQGFFNRKIAKPGDTVCVQIDQRAKKVLGLFDTEIDEEDYHKQLKVQLKSKFSRSEIKFTVDFASDSNSPLVNLADLACGFIRDKKFKKDDVAVYSVAWVANDAAVFLENQDYRRAMAAIFDQCCNGEFSRLDRLPEIFQELAPKDESKGEEYSFIWRAIRAFYEEYLERRGEFTDIMPHLSHLRDALEPEMKQKRYAQLISAEERLDFLEHLIGLETHLGAVEDRYGDEYEQLLQQEPPDRATAYWEKYLRLHVWRAELTFNRYQFAPVIKQLESLWEKQEKINEIIGSRYDLSLAEISGLLGQSYGFEKDYDDAVDWLKKDFEIADKNNRNKAASFLNCVYLHQKNFDECAQWFKEQVGAEPARFFEKIQGQQKYDGWELQSYVRLRALALELQRPVHNLPQVPTESLKKYEKAGYPWPLVLKWAALNLYLEGQEAEARELLTKVIKQLKAKNNRFTERTLAVAPYQMLGLLRSDGKLHSDYAALLADLNTVPGFADYVVKNRLQKIWQPEAKTMWKRAVCLPFYYA